MNDANEKQEIRSNRQRYARAQHVNYLRGPFSASIGSQRCPKLKIDRFGRSQSTRDFRQEINKRSDSPKDRRRARLEVNGTHCGC